MKKTFIGKMILFSISAVLLSCEALPINYSRSQSWLISEDSGGKAANKLWTTVSLIGVLVDRRGGLDSVEKEVFDLAPLFFWNQGCRMVTGDEQPVYAADIQLREREINLGWRTRRSLAVEVRIWAFEDAPERAALGRAAPGSAAPEDAPAREKLPLAVGRVVAMGERSLSSSDTTDRMLSKAIGEAIKELSAHGRRS